MKDAETEGVQMPFSGRDLEEENKALRAEIERLRKVLAANGLTSASRRETYCSGLRLRRYCRAYAGPHVRAPPEGLRLNRI